MWTPNDFMAVFDHSVWTIAQAVMSIIGFMVLIQLLFGGGDDE